MGLHVNTPPIKANTTAYGLNRKTLSHPKNTEKKGIPAGASRFFTSFAADPAGAFALLLETSRGLGGSSFNARFAHYCGVFFPAGGEEKKKVKR